MIGRMSSMQLHQGSLDVILEAQARLQRTQEELATGKRVLTPSDDPVAATQIMTIRSELSRIETLQKNANHAYSELSVAESTLAGVQDALQRVRELAVRGNNDALGAEEKAMIASEIEGLRTQIMTLANTKGASGEYIFAGFSSDQAAYIEEGGVIRFQGDDSVREVNLSSSTTIKTRMTGNEVFSVNGANVFDAMTALASSLRNEDRASFDLAFEALDASMTVVTDARSNFGVRMNQVSEQQLLNESFNLQLTKTLSGLEDLDFAKAISDMNLQLVALEAAQQAYTQSQSTSLFDYLR